MQWVVDVSAGIGERGPLGNCGRACGTSCQQFARRSRRVAPQSAWVHRMDDIARDPGANPDVEWSLYWTGRDTTVPRGFLALLDDWADIDDRERRLGIEGGTPVLVDPACRVDARLAHFFRRSRFGFLAEETKQAYAKDYRLFFSFLHQRAKYWDEAGPDDLDDYESWRRRSPDNPRRVGGSKWARELAAFKLLYGWAAAAGHLGRSPVRTHTVRLPHGTTIEVADSHPRDLRAWNVKWLPRARSACGATSGCAATTGTGYRSGGGGAARTAGTRRSPTCLSAAACG